jgi:hypothetical protein
MGMTEFKTGQTIGADGEYVLNRVIPATQEGLLEIDGDFGSGTVTPGYQGASGDFVSLKNDAGEAVTSTVPNAWVIEVPASGKLAFKLSGATNPALIANVSG